MGLIYDFDLLDYNNNIYHEIINIVKDKNIILRCRNVAKKELSLKNSFLTLDSASAYHGLKT